MKSKTSITLSREVLAALDRSRGKAENRSRLIEKALREYLTRQARAEREKKDRDILDRNAAFLNDEAEDVLSYQVKK
ncbi:MAG TPA: hypothetical protein VGL91_25600 [Acidobacteriota bacterium]|jgi:metal-responsive CopG/Arc/MetJ family transcriptional regulator